MTKTKRITPAQAIKKELKVLFPTIKFSCRFESYSMWDSVNVNWVDWPTAREVESKISKYQYGNFDGMTDMYNITNNRDDIPQTKYLFCNRDMSEKTREVMSAWSEKNYTEEFHRERYLSTYNLAESLFRHYAITSDEIEVIEKWDDNKCGIEWQWAVISK